MAMNPRPPSRGYGATAGLRPGPPMLRLLSKRLFLALFKRDSTDESAVSYVGNGHEAAELLRREE